MNISVLGAGSFGTAMANHLSLQGHEVLLWCRKEEVAQAIIKDRRNTGYFPDIALASQLSATCCLEQCIRHAHHLVLAIPTQSLRSVLDCIPRGKYRFLNLAKGVEITSGNLLHQLVHEIHPESLYSVLSGPSHAEEVIRQKPTALVVAAESARDADTWQQAFNSQLLRVYTSKDVVGVEIGGAVKNVIALATGIASGLDLGDNALAALATRGLAEMMRLGKRLQADPLSLVGLAGVGDLMATCYSALSRNVRFGKAIGRGLSLEEAQREVGQTAEGVHTAQAMMAHANELGEELPITEGVYRILYEKASLQETLHTLLSRDPKSES